MKPPVYFLGILSILFVLQCSNFLTPSNKTAVESKTVSVSFAIKTNSTFKQIARYAIVRVSAPDIDTISSPMVIDNDLLHGTIGCIPIGDNRKFEIIVTDSSDQIRYYGSQTVSLQSDKTIRVVIYLKKVSGLVEVVGILSDSIDTLWQDTTWQDTTWQDTTWQDTTWQDTTWQDTTWQDTTWQDTTWQDTTWQDTTWQDTTWQDTTWQDTTWQDTTWQDTTWQVRWQEWPDTMRVPIGECMYTGYFNTLLFTSLKSVVIVDGSAFVHAYSA